MIRSGCTAMKRRNFTRSQVRREANMFVHQMVTNSLQSGALLTMVDRGDWTMEDAIAVEQRVSEMIEVIVMR